MSAPNPGDILPLWQPEIPGEEIQAGRLGIRIRPGSPAAAKLAFIPNGPEWLRQALEEKGEIEGMYSVAKPNRPLDFIGQVDQTLLTGRLGRTPRGLALEIMDIQQLDREYVMEKSRLNLRYQELQLVQQWDGDLEGFTALVLRARAKTLPILDSTLRFVEHLRAYREQLAEATVRRYEALEQWIECPRCENISSASNGIHCPECGEDMRGGEYVRAALRLLDGDGRIYRGIDSLTVRASGFPEYRGMTLDRVQGSTLWVSFRRYDPLPDEGVVLPTASVEMFDAQRSVIRQLQIASPRTGALAAQLADPGWLGSPPRLALEGRRAHHLPDPNEEQAEAVARVMGMRPGQLYLIQGPPGTGKTTAIVESIRRILGRNPSASILLSSHSNDAVDTGQERLLGFSHVRQARIAEPGKVPRRLRHTLVEGDDLDIYNLVAGTVNRLAIDSRLRFRVFDWLILDEANKVRTNEALALMPLAKRWVMIGDPKQLPPVMEEAALTFELRSPLDQVIRDDSFYGYMWDQVPPTSRIMLPRQYRMREPLGRVVSDLFYEGKLIHEAPHPKMPLPWPFDRELVWVDTGAQEEYRDAQRSVANEFEVALCKDITTIIRKRVRKAKLAVIAMYSSQVNRLVSALKGIVPPDDIESVDAFEGRESDGVILSLVRSNERAAIGFLNDPNRVNVAISRARKLLVIVGDSKTVMGGAPELFGPLFEHAQQDGLVVGVGAVVTACQRVGIRSQVQKLSKPKRSERRRSRRKRRREQAATAEVIPMQAEEVASEPVASEPVTSEPVTSEPVTSEPVTSEPVTSEPVTSEPVTSEPVTSEPVTSEPVAPEPVAPEPVVPEPVVPEPVVPEPVAPEPVAPEPVGRPRVTKSRRRTATAQVPDGQNTTEGQSDSPLTSPEEPAPATGRRSRKRVQSATVETNGVAPAMTTGSTSGEQAGSNTSSAKRRRVTRSPSQEQDSAHGQEVGSAVTENGASRRHRKTSPPTQTELPLEAPPPGS